MPESWEVLKEAISGVGAKKVAHDLGVSTSLVYKWCEASQGGDDSSGARNPLDRIVDFYKSTGSDEVTEWICQQQNCFPVSNPVISDDPIDADFFNRMQEIIQDFSALLQALGESMADDRRVDKEEAARIRKEWERLKRFGEEFACACEKGLFGDRP